MRLSKESRRKSKEFEGRESKESKEEYQRKSRQKGVTVSVLIAQDVLDGS